MFAKPELSSLIFSQWKNLLKIPCRYRYNWVLHKIIRDKTFQHQCRNAGLSKTMLSQSFETFARDLVYNGNPSIMESLKVQYVLDGILESKYEYSSIFPLFLIYAKQKFPLLQNWAKLHELSDLSNPEKWYRHARKMKRSIIFHAGPTNSGKTHAALKRFLASNTGIYCCPLRLLAREVSAKSKAKNVKCSLITGEEIKHKESDTHVACTVEMTNLNKEFDVAIIDEIQIIAHEERGWAWTQALLGVQASEVHVCGEPRAIPIVRKLSEECGDDFFVQEYERLTKLRVKKHAVGSIDKLKSGDCVVCFRRKDIYETVSELQRNGEDVAMIYGKLPPSTKRKEAQKFNNVDNGCDILVATDAVGMGLNLNIKRIVFKSLEKGVKDKNGEIVRKQLTTPEVLQIAGRAGRYGFQQSGEVTTLYSHDIGVLHDLISDAKQDITHARINPTMEHYVKFSNKMPNCNLHQILSKFKELCQVNDEFYQLCSQRDCLDLAEIIKKLDLSFTEAYKFSLCPINSDRNIPVAMFMRFAECYSQSKIVTYSYIVSMLLGFGIKLPFLPTSHQEEITNLEDVHNALGAYLWLSQKFPRHFPDYAKIFYLRNRAENIITLSLSTIRSKFTFGNFDRMSKKKKKQRKQKMKPIIYY
uniref:ATP-dependent RNA helicase SUPV3L1, mitochondrial-like n=1 Tax=Styela clava TaxID=7725 RepID=UPI0019397E6A|nr:ATP-dependent RNA helicase SUPV3L1, mitochondrial-like [Styela clava]